MIFDGLVTTWAKSASAIRIGAAPTVAATEPGPPEPSSPPTSAASSGISTSPSTRAAVVPAAVRMVANRIGTTLVLGLLPAAPQGPSGKRPLLAGACVLYDPDIYGTVAASSTAAFENRRRARQLP